MMDLIERIESVAASHAEGEAFSGVVVIESSGKRLFERAYGFAHRSCGTPNRIDTRFQTASGTKTFTAAAVLRVIDQGELTLGTSVNAVVADLLPNIDPTVTIGHLLTHTSGVPDYFDEESHPPEDFEKLWWERPCYRMRRPSDFLPWMRDLPMASRPGHRFRYNNGGYILLGIILERVCGTSYHEAVHTHVFEPAGMDDSGFFEADRLPERTALAYIDETDGSWRTNVFSVPSLGMPDGGAYVTAEDMVRFWTALNEGRLFRRDLVEQMLSARIPVDERGGSYGYGVWIRPGYCVAVGSDPGVTFSSGRFSAGGETATVIGNCDEVGWHLWRDLSRLLVE